MKVNPLELSALISGAGLIISISVSAFISGSHWGQLQSDVRMMSDRLAKIEGMFTLRLKNGDLHDN